MDKNLSSYVWDYASKHGFVSRNTVSSKYIDKFLKIEGGRDGRKPVQKQISRQISQLFVIMKHLGICNRYSLKTVAINREIFNNFTLQHVLKYSWHDVNKKVKLKA